MEPARIAASISAVAAIASLAFSYCQFGVLFDKTNHIKVAQVVVLCVWIILPPVWFWFEYFFVPRNPGQTFEEFKYGQDVAAKIWLGLVTALLGLYFGKDIFSK